MIQTITFFSEEKELSQLTGLNHDQLWEAGFNLDDWDFGFVTDKKWSDEWESPAYERWVLNHIDSHCCGYEHVEHNGKHYYMLYHS